MNADLWKTVDTYLRSNDVNGAAVDLEWRLRTVATDRFASLTDSHFTNSPIAVFEHIKAVAKITKDFDRCSTRILLH